MWHQPSKHQLHRMTRRKWFKDVYEWRQWNLNYYFWTEGNAASYRVGVLWNWPPSKFTRRALVFYFVISLAQTWEFWNVPPELPATRVHRGAPSTATTALRSPWHIWYLRDDGTLIMSWLGHRIHALPGSDKILWFISNLLVNSKRVFVLFFFLIVKQTKQLLKNALYCRFLP